MVSCIWQALILPSRYAEFFSNLFQAWLMGGFSKNFGKEDEQKWYSTFAVTLWFLWRRRNQRVFEQAKNHHEDPARTIQRLVAENQIAVQLRRNEMQHGRNHSLSEWRAPLSGWFKLNTDGAVCQGINKGAIGGLIRDEKGYWIRGFSQCLGVCSSVSAELWGILEGLLLAKSLNIDKLEVECDASEVIQAIEEELDETVMTNPNQLVVKIAQVVKMNWTVVFSVVPRQANKCADCLAKEALSHSTELRIFHSPEREVQCLYFADFKNVN